MPKRIVHDPDSPELTDEMIRTARPLRELASGQVVRAMRRARGLQKAPRKEMISIRLNPTTLDAYRQTGKGWQSLMAEDLERAVRRRAPKAAVAKARGRQKRASR